MKCWSARNKDRSPCVAASMKAVRELDRIELGERASYWLTMEQLVRDVVPEEDLEVSVTAYLIAVMELAGKPQWT